MQLHPSFPVDMFSGERRKNIASIYIPTIKCRGRREQGAGDAECLVVDGVWRQILLIPTFLLYRQPLEGAADLTYVVVFQITIDPLYFYAESSGIVQINPLTHAFLNLAYFHLIRFLTPLAEHGPTCTQLETNPKSPSLSSRQMRGRGQRERERIIIFVYYYQIIPSMASLQHYLALFHKYEPIL